LRFYARQRSQTSGGHYDWNSHQIQGTLRANDSETSTPRAATALAAAPVPVLAQETAPDRSAVIDVSNARNAPIPIAVPDMGGGPLGAAI